MVVKELQKPKTLRMLKWELTCTTNPVTRAALKEIIKSKEASDVLHNTSNNANQH